MHRFPGLQIYGKCIKKKELCSVKNKIITRRNGDEMEDYSIANTTKEQRIALIRQWIPDEDGLGDSGDMDLWDIYADYINGKREIAVMETWFYEVVSIDGDYANLRRTDIESNDLKLVARALLPAEILEGSKLKYELMQYELIG